MRLTVHGMSFNGFGRGEKKVLIAALAVGCVVGSLAGYLAYLDVAEAHFHGGVLEEDAAKAQFALIWESAWAFTRWGLGSFFLLGVAPIAVWRIFRGHR